MILLADLSVLVGSQFQLEGEFVGQVSGSEMYTYSGRNYLRLLLEWTVRRKGDAFVYVPAVRGWSVRIFAPTQLLVCCDGQTFELTNVSVGYSPNSANTSPKQTIRFYGPKHDWFIGGGANPSIS